MPRNSPVWWYFSKVYNITQSNKSTGHTTTILGSLEDVEHDKMVGRIMSSHTHSQISLGKIVEVDPPVPMSPHARNGDSIGLLQTW